MPKKMAFICPCHLHMTCTVHILHVHSLKLALQVIHSSSISSYISAYFHLFRDKIWRMHGQVNSHRNRWNDMQLPLYPLIRFSYGQRVPVTSCVVILLLYVYMLHVHWVRSLLCSYCRFWRILIWSISIIIMAVNVYFIIIQVVSRIHSLRRNIGCWLIS